MSHTYCCAKWCDSSTYKGQSRFFRVPADHRFEAWVKYANRPDLLQKPRRQVHSSYRLCSKHFSKECFTSTDCSRLLRSAVPSTKVRNHRLRALVHPDFFTDVPEEVTATPVVPPSALLDHDYCPSPPGTGSTSAPCVDIVDDTSTGGTEHPDSPSPPTVSEEMESSSFPNLLTLPGSPPVKTSTASQRVFVALKSDAQTQCMTQVAVKCIQPALQPRIQTSGTQTEQDVREIEFGRHSSEIGPENAVASLQQCSGLLRPSDSNDLDTSMEPNIDSPREVMRKAASKGRKKLEAEERFHRQNVDLLHSDREDGTHAACSKELERLREENRELHSRVAQLEKALCSRLFETELMLQQKAPKCCACEQHERPPSTEDGDRGHGPAMATTEVVTFSEAGGEVYLGHGVWLPREAYDHLMARPKDSIFVREACAQIFSTAGLVNRSVTGATSNRTKAKAKPALDAMKFAALESFFRHYLGKKCAPEEAAVRHRSINKIVAMKIKDVMNARKRAKK